MSNLTKKKSLTKIKEPFTPSVIDYIKNLLIREEDNKMVLGVKAPTGIGKSSLLIKKLTEAILKHYLEEYKQPVKFCIFVVQPTIPATIGLYKYMKKLLEGTKLKVGYSVEGKVRYDKDTNIIYCTSGHAENIMLGYFQHDRLTSPVNFCNILVIDEAHGGTLSQDTIVSLWETAKTSGRSVPKLLFMSADLDMGEVGYPNSTMYEITTKKYPLTLEYTNKDYEVDDVKLYNDVAEKLYKDHFTLDIIPKDTLVSKIKYPGFDVWICFCPGQKEVLSVYNRLTEMYESYIESFEGKLPEKTLDIVPVYGSLKLEEYDKIFNDPPVGTRRIIISTNLAESSVTISFVTAIYDTLTEKYITTTRTGSESLTLSNISKSSANQRAGRAGRLCPGRVVRFCTPDNFNTFTENRSHEIKRIPLHKTLINILSIDLDPIKVFHGKIEIDSIINSERMLKFLGMIDEDNKVTEMGYFSSKYPLAVRPISFLWNWAVEGNPIFPGIVIASLINCFDPSYFYYPSLNEVKSFEAKEAKKMEHYNKYFRKYSGDTIMEDHVTDYHQTGKTDIEVLFVMFYHLLHAVGSLSPKKAVLHEWCLKNSMNQKKITELLNTVVRVCNIFSKNEKVDIHQTTLKPLLAIQLATPIIDLIYSDQVVNLDPSSNSYRLGHRKFLLDKKNFLQTNNVLYKHICVISSRETNVQNAASNKPKIVTLFAPIRTSSHWPIDYDIKLDKSEIIHVSKWSETIEEEDLDENNISDRKIVTRVSVKKKDQHFEDEDYEDDEKGIVIALPVPKVEVAFKIDMSVKIKPPVRVKNPFVLKKQSDIQSNVSSPNPVRDIPSSTRAASPKISKPVKKILSVPKVKTPSTPRADSPRAASPKISKPVKKILSAPKVQSPSTSGVSSPLPKSGIKIIRLKQNN
jgi:HrpA-like RNA helicase